MSALIVLALVISCLAGFYYWSETKKRPTTEPRADSPIILNPAKHLINIPRCRGWTPDWERCIIPQGKYEVMIIFYQDHDNPSRITTMEIRPYKGKELYLIGEGVPYTIEEYPW